jgi:hypothetical protein
MRRTQRGTRRVFTITWVVLALMLGMLGLRYRKSHAASHAGAPAQRAQPGANPEPNRAPLPAKPANDRNG